MRYALLEPFRGIAALWVFCFHYHFSEAFRETFPALHSTMRVGDLGVPMFFVISGYCITAAVRSAIKNKLHWSRFLFRRVKRIYPPFWLSIAVVVSIPFAIEFISSLKTGEYTAPSASQLNYGFLNYDWLDWALVASLAKVFQNLEATSLQHKFTTINAVYWTLAIEVQFYLVVTAILAVCPRYFYQAVLGVTAASLGAAWIPGISTSGWFFPFWSMFAAGVFLYWILEQGITPEKICGRHHLGLTVATLVALLIGFLGFAVTDHRFDHQFFAALFCGFLFLLHSMDRRYAENVEVSKNVWIRAAVIGITTLGAMSYSLYLLHGRLQFLIMQFARQVLPTDSIPFDVVVIIATTATCFVFYWFCEKPFIGSPKSKKQIERAKPDGVAAA